MVNIADDLLIEREMLGNIGLVKADGIVDLATMRPMREAVRSLIADGVQHMVLDLRKVAYMDSAGISIIMTAKRGTERGQVYIVTQPGEVQRALQLVQMDRIVHLVTSPEQAMEELSAS